MQVRSQTPHVFLGQTTSLCAECLTPVPAKILVEDGRVYSLKRCRTHGVSRVLVEAAIALIVTRSVTPRALYPPCVAETLTSPQEESTDGIPSRSRSRRPKS